MCARPTTGQQLTNLLLGPSQQPKGAGSAYCLFPENETEKKEGDLLRASQLVSCRSKCKATIVQAPGYHLSHETKNPATHLRDSYAGTKKR